MKIIKWLFIILLVLVLAFVVISLLLPKDYVVERSVTIDAPPEKIHPHVADLKQWPKWMTWSEGDPSIEVTYGEVTKGVGASQTWTGESGDGEVEVTASDPKRGVEYDMFFIMGEGEDARVPSKSEILYTPQGDATQVTWRMSGDMPGFFGGWIRMIVAGTAPTEFDKGLAKLKTLVEEKGT